MLARTKTQLHRLKPGPGASFIRGPGDGSLSLGCEALCWLEWDHHSTDWNNRHSRKQCHPEPAAAGSGPAVCPKAIETIEETGASAPEVSLCKRNQTSGANKAGSTQPTTQPSDSRCKAFPTAPSPAERPHTSASPSAHSSSTSTNSATPAISAISRPKSRKPASPQPSTHSCAAAAQDGHLSGNPSSSYLDTTPAPKNAAPSNPCSSQPQTPSSSSQSP